MNEQSRSVSGNPILVVDDNADAAITLAMLLRLKGYAVQTGYSGQQALDMARAIQPWAILLDISMPGLDGYETCRLLRQQPEGQDLLLIALTGYGQDKDRQRSLEAGFDGHLAKPVELAVLIQLLTDLQTSRKTNHPSS